MSVLNNRSRIPRTVAPAAVRPQVGSSIDAPAPSARPGSSPPSPPELLCACFDETRHILWATGGSHLYRYIPGLDYWIDDGAISGFGSDTPQAMWADDGEVVVVGNGLSPAHTTRWSADSASWTTGLAAMTHPEQTAGRTTQGGASNPYLYVAGGSDGGGSHSRLQRYDPVGNSWTDLSNINGGVSFVQENLIAVGDYLYQLSGGISGSRKYRISTDTWSTITGASADITASGIPGVYIGSDTILRGLTGGYRAYTISSDTYSGSTTAWPGAVVHLPLWMINMDGVLYVEGVGRFEP